MAEHMPRVELIGSYVIDGEPRKLFRVLRDFQLHDQDDLPATIGDLLVFTGIGRDVQVCRPMASDIVNG